MTTECTIAPARHRTELFGQTVVVIGGSSGIGLETARQARSEGAAVILAGLDPEPLEHVAREIGAAEQCGVRSHRLRTAREVL
jgi:NAD(P)-dependent dehydrogenase (short-subunit alcohol dehydrogenase family)